MERPKTRGECRNGLRPCPFASCRYHLLLNVESKYIRLSHGHDDPTQLEETCALDVADRGEELPIGRVAELLGATEEAVKRQTMGRAYKKLHVIQEAKEYYHAFEEMRQNRPEHLDEGFNWE